MLQQAIGAIAGEIRVCLQGFFQGRGSRGPNTKHCDVLLNIATEEIAHIDMLATAAALNVEGAPTSLRETGAASSPVMNAVMGGGERPRHGGVPGQRGRSALRLLARLRQRQHRGGHVLQLGQEPVLGPARPDPGAQREQMTEAPTNASLRS